MSTQKSLGEFKPIVVATPPRKELNRSIGSEGNLNYTPKKEIIQISEAKRVQLLDEIYTSLKEVKDHLSLVVIGHVDAGLFFFPSFHYLFYLRLFYYYLFYFYHFDTYFFNDYLSLV